MTLPLLYHFIVENSTLLACYVFKVASDRVIPLLLYPALLEQVAGYDDWRSAATIDFSLQRSSMVAEITFYSKSASLNIFTI